MALAPSRILLATFLVGTAFGGMFACAPVITGELFGHQHFGKNWGFIVFGGAVGSLSFGAAYGAVYASETPEGCDACAGSHCYRKMFVISSVALLVGVAACANLARYGAYPAK